MYHDLAELLSLSEQRQVPLWRIVLENEMRLTGQDEDAVFSKLQKHFDVMEKSATKALEKPQPTAGSLISGISAPQNTYAKGGETLCGGLVNEVMAMALSSSEVNASMGRICAAPTAGACGILPAVLIGLRKKLHLSLEQTLHGLLTASGIGAVIMENATVSGAAGGCQAECGVAAAMAAAAAVEMAGGTPHAAVNASGFALMNAMGLICDPVAGLVQVPCAQRNASQAVNALLSADLALAGMLCVIPPDEIIDAMYKVGKLLPAQLRETAQGGIAATKTGRQIAADILRA
jgi:L-serine dehydratase